MDFDEKNFVPLPVSPCLLKPAPWSLPKKIRNTSQVARFKLEVQNILGLAPHGT
jgi:hypothetical protein